VRLLRLLRGYARCVANDRWPGYDTDPAVLIPPEWLMDLWSDIDGNLRP